MEKRNRQKAKLLYDAIDARPDSTKSVEKSARSTMNVIFNLPTPELEAGVSPAAEEAGMEGLKGHARSVDPASIYNAVTPEWVKALAELMTGSTRVMMAKFSSAIRSAKRVSSFSRMPRHRAR